MKSSIKTSTSRGVGEFRSFIELDGLVHEDAPIPGSVTICGRWYAINDETRGWTTNDLDEIPTCLGCTLAWMR